MEHYFETKQYFMVVDFVTFEEGKVGEATHHGCRKDCGGRTLLSLIAGDGETFVVVMVRSVQARSARSLKLYTRDTSQETNTRTLTLEHRYRALLDQSRQRLRGAFSTIITKGCTNCAIDPQARTKICREIAHSRVQSLRVYLVFSRISLICLADNNSNTTLVHPQRSRASCLDTWKYLRTFVMTDFEVKQDS